MRTGIVTLLLITLTLAVISAFIYELPMWFILMPIWVPVTSFLALFMVVYVAMITLALIEDGVEWYDRHREENRKR